METIASLTHDDFGKEIGLLHEVLVTGKKVGATKDFFAHLAHNQEKFRRALDAVYNSSETYAVGARQFSVEEYLKKYEFDHMFESFKPQLLSRFANTEIPQVDFNVTFVGGLSDGATISKVATYLRLRGYRPLTLPESLLLCECEGFFIPVRQRHFLALGTPTCGVDGMGTAYVWLAGSAESRYLSLIDDGSPYYPSAILPAIRL